MELKLVNPRTLKFNPDNPRRTKATPGQDAQLGPMDQWRAIEALCGAGWSEEAIATSFSYPVRTIQKLRLLAKIHPAMLDHMALNLPREEELRTIAAAPCE